jgi:phosphohistidine phosphatase
MRHAKAALAEPGMKDFDRPLATEGLEEAARTARALLAQGILPDAVIVSPARRTRETLGAVLAVLAVSPPVRTDALLYSGTTAAYLDAAASAEETVLVVGHNPMTEQAAFELAGSLSEAHDDLRKGFATAAAAIFDLPPDGAPPRLTHYITP